MVDTSTLILHVLILFEVNETKRVTRRLAPFRMGNSVVNYGWKLQKKLYVTKSGPLTIKTYMVMERLNSPLSTFYSQLVLRRHGRLRSSRKAFSACSQPYS